MNGEKEFHSNYVLRPIAANEDYMHNRSNHFYARTIFHPQTHLAE